MRQGSPGLIRRSLLAAFAIVAVGCSGAPSPSPEVRPSPPGSPSPTGSVPQSSPGRFARIACRLPREKLIRVIRGYFPGRSGYIQIVPAEGNYFGGYSHSGPWDYLQRVPMLLYGPGHVPALGRVRRPVTFTDVAPTLARYVGFDYEAPDGRPMDEAVLPSQEPPRLIVVLVWDGGGRNVMAAYPHAWPNVRRLISRGVFFENATVGTSPSVTPTVHTTLGTGAYPRRHGLVDLRFRLGNELVPPVVEGPGNLLVPSMADLYDRARGNRPLVGFIGSEVTIGMMGQGSFSEGGDRDLAAAQRKGVWGLSPGNVPYYELPRYVLNFPGLDEAVRRLDVQDGSPDGLWLGEPVLDDPEGVSDSPAYAEYQTQVIREILRREGFGEDDVPDLLFTNYKQIDKVGHRWSMPSPQMEAVVRSSDRAVGDLVRILNQDVGQGRWALVVTGDSGTQPRTRGFRIDIAAMAADIAAEFDPDSDDRRVVTSPRVTQIWIDRQELADNGFILEQVAGFLARYTKGENVADPAVLASGEAEDRLFAAAFPSTVLEGTLPCLAGSGQP